MSEDLNQVDLAVFEKAARAAAGLPPAGDPQDGDQQPDADITIIRKAAGLSAENSTTTHKESNRKG